MAPNSSTPGWGSTGPGMGLQEPAFVTSILEDPAEGTLRNEAAGA